ncbi:MAG: TIGR02266 family protein [Myxococcales bacterium]|nr:TIGR02266 family protein [Myxococcales bacterium]
MSKQSNAEESARNYSDLRSHERVAIEIAVNMESENNFFAGITDNISEGGVFVATLMPPPRGSVIEMNLTLPGLDRAFSVRGVVCWIRDLEASIEGAPPGCGIRWMEMSRDALLAIHRFVQHRDTILFDVDDL